MIRWLGTVTILLAAALPAASQDEDLTLETCSLCHDEAEAFAAGPHGRVMAARDPELLEGSCNACHAVSPEHLEEPLPETVTRVPAPEACAGCHGNSSGQLLLATPAHPRHGVACLDCHVSGHEDPGTERLLAADPFTLCGDCHGFQASAASLPFSHRDGAEPFACTRCHSLHSSTRVGRLALHGNGGVCIDCHTETAGPFVFPHPPREVEGCLACHQPHGSTNPRLLIRRTVLNLCLECHTNAPGFHDITRPRFRSCLNCHFAVHGSNRDPKLFDE